MNLPSWPLAVILLSSSILPTYAAPAKLGGQTATTTTKKEVQDAADFAVKAQEKALQASSGNPSDKLELVSIVSAKEQVVSGMNYHLKIKVKHNGATKTADAIVWWQSWRKPEPFQLTSWEWSKDGAASSPEKNKH